MPDHLRRPIPLESAEYEAGVRILRAAGFAVYRISQARASKQTPGLPDCFALHPRRQLALWWEVKRQRGGRTSPAQEAFAAQARAVGGTMHHVLGARDALIAWLEQQGVLAMPPVSTPDSIPHPARS